jgi:hypothetical protein
MSKLWERHVQALRLVVMRTLQPWEFSSNRQPIEIHWQACEFVRAATEWRSFSTYNQPEKGWLCHGNLDPVHFWDEGCSIQLSICSEQTLKRINVWHRLTKIGRISVWTGSLSIGGNLYFYFMVLIVDLQIIEFWCDHQDSLIMKLNGLVIFNSSSKWENKY